MDVELFGDVLVLGAALGLHEAKVDVFEDLVELSDGLVEEAEISFDEAEGKLGDLDLKLEGEGGLEFPEGFEFRGVIDDQN